MSKGGSTTVKDNSTQQVQLPQWMSDAGKSLFDKSMADSAASPVTAYKGELSAPMDANQKAALARRSRRQDGPVSDCRRRKAVARGTAKGDRVSTSNFDAAAAAKYMSPYLADVQGRTVSDMMRNGQMQLDGPRRFRRGEPRLRRHSRSRRSGRSDEGHQQQHSRLSRALERGGLRERARPVQHRHGPPARRATTNAGAHSVRARPQDRGRRRARQPRPASERRQRGGINNLLKTGTVAQQTQDAADQAAYNEALRVQDGTINRDEDLMAILAGTPRNVTTKPPARRRPRPTRAGSTLRWASAEWPRRSIRTSG
jgi:hypothetical protein